MEGGPLQLPRRGRQGIAPPWPLPPIAAHTSDDLEAERRLWEQAWRTPQAVEWERWRWTGQVALWVRATVLADQGWFGAAAEAAELADSLGLTAASMGDLGWVIAGGHLNVVVDDRQQ